MFGGFGFPYVPQPKKEEPPIEYSDMCFCTKCQCHYLSAVCKAHPEDSKPKHIKKEKK